MNDNTSFVVAVLRELAASAAMILAAWGALGGATNALTTKMRLRPRREAERDLFRHGRYPNGTLPVWAVDAGGRVDFSKPLRRLTEAEALQLLRPEPVPAAPGTAAAPAAPEPADRPGWLVRLAALFSQLLRRA